MYVLDYLIYHLKPYGIVNTPDVLPSKLQIGELLPSPKEPVEAVEAVEPKEPKEPLEAKEPTEGSNTEQTKKNT